MEHEEAMNIKLIIFIETHEIIILIHEAVKYIFKVCQKSHIFSAGIFSSQNNDKLYYYLLLHIITFMYYYKLLLCIQL